jgi:hypothetical protein
MKRIVIVSALCLGLLPGPAHAQSFNVRRMAMGGAILGGRQGGEGANVAYRALPKPANGRSVSLPIGLIPLLSDPPSFDPRDSTFNVFEIANLIENPPWNLALVEPVSPSNDITLDVSRNSLAMNLGDLGRVFPQGHVRAYGATNGPTAGFSIRRLFVVAAPLVEFDNDLEPNAALSAVVRDGELLAPNSQYRVYDHGRAQAAAALHVGMALPVWSRGDRVHPSSALYGGARVKLIRGLAYGEADNVAAFDTGDTLFGSQSLDLRYTGHYRDAGPADGGLGYGLDAGVVWVLGRLEFGAAMNDIGTRIAWKVRETHAYRDSVTGDFVQQTVREGVAFTSDVPTVALGNVAWHGTRWMAAADVQHTMLATTAHAGLERWVGPVALRAGAGLDANHRTQVSGGLGVALGRIGLAAAVATHNRNLENQRLVELGVGLEVLR